MGINVEGTPLKKFDSKLLLKKMINVTSEDTRLKIKPT